ncbi:MAG TPA: LacI family DNA-binding transcriptional regulator [Candidatus Atribacteria bacterium]|nr:LacI family DNA-binding transcriptional regulator [Candidatus Atribacteria bacterium]
MRKKITIKDIAQELNVSVATVSRALNGEKGVNSDLRKKVIKKAQNMGYFRWSSLNLLNGEPKKIAVIFPENDYFWEKVDKGVQDAQELLQHSEIELKFFRTTGHNLAQQNQLLENILQKEKIDGLALVPADFTQLDYFINALYLKGVAVATFNIDAPLSKRLFYVGQNSNQAGRVTGKIFDYLLRGKEGKISILTSNKRAPSHMGRWQGLIDFVHKKGLSLDVSQVVEAKDDEEAYKITKDKLLEEKDLLGIFVSTAFGNIGVGKALKEKGKKDLVVIGNDLGEGWIPHIKEGIIDCCLFQAPYLQGYLALMLLAKFLLFEENPPDKNIFIPIIPVFSENLDGDFLNFEQCVTRHASLNYQFLDTD